MDLTAVEKIADAVLYEGYLLYPYRRSAIKNQQRFNFGVLYPVEYCRMEAGCEASEMQTECLFTGSEASTVQVKIRFLHLVTRGDHQEGIEREIFTSAVKPGSAVRVPFVFDELRGEWELAVTSIDAGLFQATLNIRNLTDFEDSPTASRDSALLCSFVSVHSILRVEQGEFVSALDPPAEWKAAVSKCRNMGTWPVLAGAPESRQTVLSSAIILYDYPEIAPDSPGDLFDGTEIDEILALRILTMTDAEKKEVREGDDRARLILERTELLPPEHFQKLHGSLRGLRGSSAEADQ